MPNKRIAQLVHTKREDRDDWRTPAWVISLVKSVFGGAIDCDPASSERANTLIGAKTIYTLETNGLMHDWLGSVWVNPPYGRYDNSLGYAGLFAQKFVLEYQNTHMKEGIMLLPINATAAYFWLFFGAYPLCVLREKVAFRKDGRESMHMMGSMLIYAGTKREMFIEAFQPYGKIVLPEGVI